MASTITVLLAVWLALNATFVAIRLYVTADQRAHAERDIVRYPRLVS